MKLPEKNSNGIPNFYNNRLKMKGNFSPVMRAHCAGGATSISLTTLYSRNRTTLLCWTGFRSKGFSEHSVEPFKEGVISSREPYILLRVRRASTCFFSFAQWKENHRLLLFQRWMDAVELPFGKKKSSRCITGLWKNYFLFFLP